MKASLSALLCLSLLVGCKGKPLKCHDDIAQSTIVQILGDETEKQTQALGEKGLAVAYFRDHRPTVATILEKTRLENGNLTCTATLNLPSADSSEQRTEQPIEYDYSWTSDKKQSVVKLHGAGNIAETLRDYVIQVGHSCVDTKFLDWRKEANMDVAVACQADENGDECKAAEAKEAQGEHDAVERLRKECGIASEYLPAVIYEEIKAEQAAQAAAEEAAANDPLACDNEQVQAKALEQLNDQITGLLRQFGGGGAAAAMTMDELTDIETLNTTGSGGHSCAAVTKGGKRQGTTGYVTSWHNKAEGMFRVDVVDVNALRAKYGK